MTELPSAALLKLLAAEGVSAWLTGSNQDEFTCAVSACGSQQSLFCGAVAPAETSTQAIQMACDALLPAYTENGGRRGHVSVDLGSSHGAPGHRVESVRAAIQRRNLLVRIPATDEGVAAIPACLAQGIGIDVGPVFSTERYRQVLRAYLVGMEQALVAGQSLPEVAAVVSVPVGLIDSEVDARLDALRLRAHDRIRGAAALALARQLFRIREQYLVGGWWRVLRASGAYPPPLVWTTVTPRHVTALVGWNTAHVLSADVLGYAARTARPAGDTPLNAHHDSSRVLAALERLGIRMSEVAAVLERGGHTLRQHSQGRTARSRRLPCQRSGYLPGPSEGRP